MSLSVRWLSMILRTMAVSFLTMVSVHAQGQFFHYLLLAGEPTHEERLALARKLLSEVERSPSANLDELRDKLRRARAETLEFLKDHSEHPEATQLIARIDSLFAQLGPRARPEHPTMAEAEAVRDRLISLIKAGGRRSEVEKLHTHLRKLARRLEAKKAADAARYEKDDRDLWDFYTSRLAKVDNVCAGCPTLDVASLAKGFDRPRMLGAGDYTLDDLAIMEEDPKTQKPRYTPLLTGDFNRDGSVDVALIGRGTQKGKEELFLLIATKQKDSYRRLFLQRIDWDKAALTVRNGRLIVSENFYAGDDFWVVIWNGKTFEFRYSGDEMSRGSR